MEAPAYTLYQIIDGYPRANKPNVSDKLPSALRDRNLNNKISMYNSFSIAYTGDRVT